jgi:glucuronoarabinoxylan endo-1,4-beta-xylanase
MLKGVCRISKKLSAGVVVLMLLLVASSVFSQNLNITVKGTISGSSTPISKASLTLVDKSDTTNQITTMTDAAGNYSLNMITAVASSPAVPSDFTVEQNYPNPFSSSTSISYTLNKQTDVRISIYDALGREVKKFNVGNQNVGVHGIQWDARNNFGEKLASGVYFYRVRAGSKSLTNKMMLGNTVNRNYIPSVAFSMHADPSQQVVKNVLGTKNFQIRIDNTSRTSPVIVPKIIDNVYLSNDTTINISVEKKAIIETATIYIDSVRQIVRGFGASSVLLWRPDLTDNEINKAFGTGDGQLGFSILRMMVEADSNRWGLYIPTARKAQAMGVTLIASPWYAPPSMVDTVSGRIIVRPTMYDRYAAHLNSYNAYMNRNAVSMYAVSVQNEPDMNQTWTSFLPDEMLTFMKVNAPAITGTKVMAPESFQFRRQMSDPILNDSVACAHTDIICGHLYGSGLAPYPLAESKGKEIWMTEYLSGENNSGNDWTWCVPVATQMHAVLNVGWSAYVWWNLVRFYGPISDGTTGATSSGNKGDVTKKGYVMSQFARFIRPGYHVIKSTSSRLSVNITAAKGDASKVVIVVTNTETEPIQQSFALQNSSVNSFTPYTTTSTKNCEKGAVVSAQNGSFTVTLEPLSVMTFVSN